MSDDSRRLDLGDKPATPASGPSGWEYLVEGGRIKCIFSTSQKSKVGTGTSSRNHDVLTYWFVEQTADETFEARKLNERNVPAGDIHVIPTHKLVNEFTPRLSHYETVVLPAMRELNDIIAQGDAFRNDGRLYCAEMEYDRALEIEAMNVRALFGLGLIYTARRELSKTRELLTELVNIKATFHGKNQYLFNEFGIALRKTGLFNEAILYYDKALKITKKDEHLYYNLARAHYENGNWSYCLDNLIRSHTLNPKLKLTQHLFEVIVGLADDERLLRHYNKPPIPPEVAQTARRILAAEQGHVSLDEGPVLNHNRQENARSGDRIFSSDRQNDE